MKKFKVIMKVLWELIKFLWISSVSFGVFAAGFILLPYATTYCNDLLKQADINTIQKIVVSVFPLWLLITFIIIAFIIGRKGVKGFAGSGMNDAKL